MALTQVASTNIKQVWKTIDADSCPYNYNFHMHTNCSDGRLKPETLIQQAIEIGLKGFAITDHHSIRGYQIAQRELADVRREQTQVSLPHLWTGIEVTASLLHAEVHLLGYDFTPEHPAMQTYTHGQSPQGSEAIAANVIDAIHQAGGLVVLAHPARYRVSAQKLIPAAAEAGVDGVETYYAYSNPNPWKPSRVETEQVKQLSDRYNLFNTCGTDTHGLNLLIRI